MLREREKGSESERERERESVVHTARSRKQADRQQVVERIGGLSLVFASQVDLPPHQQ